MYEALNQPIPNVGEYLARIGLSEAPTPTLDGLEALIWAHQTHVPFEDLNTSRLGLPVSLEIPALYDKVVVRRRGGYCFELNSLLHALLVALGYCVYPVAVRIQMGRAELFPTTHRGEIVLLDGKKYYCDVGFGAIAFPTAIPLDGSESPEGFRIVPEGEFLAVQQRQGGEWSLLMRFADRPTDPVDFVMPNFYTSQNPAGLFRQVLSVALMRGGVRRQLAGDTLREYEGKTVLSERKIADDAELTQVLREEFGIDYQIKKG